MNPSPLLASVDPALRFDPDQHVACDDVFVARSMSPLDDSVEALLHGVGMPDRATEGWLRVEGRDGLSVLGVRGIDPGRGQCEAPLPGEPDPPLLADVYVDDDALWLSVPRARRREALELLQGVGLSAEDRTADVGRIGLTGPDAAKLLAALEFEDSTEMSRGDHVMIDVIEEPVRVCRSDFPGPPGHDLVIAAGPFNMVLAVLCSWAVRLELMLLPVGLDAVAKVREKVKAV